MYRVMHLPPPGAFSGTTSATMAAPAAHSPPMPRLATIRKINRTQMFGAKAHAAVPSE